MAIDFVGTKREDINIDLLLETLSMIEYEQIARQLLAEHITHDINYMRETLGRAVTFSVVESEVGCSTAATVRYIQARMQYMTDEIVRAIVARKVTVQGIMLDAHGFRDASITID